MCGRGGTSRRNIRRSSNLKFSTCLAQVALLRLVFDTAALRGNAKMRSCRRRDAFRTFRARPIRYTGFAWFVQAVGFYFFVCSRW